MYLSKVSTVLVLLPLRVWSHPTISNVVERSFISTMSINAQSMFNASMSWMDYEYDDVAGYLYGLGSDGSNVALRHDTRLSSWYAVGLLARNEGDDAIQAQRIITNVISHQFKNVSQQWYGDYQKEPEEPTVDTPYYLPVIYNSWDPNWRGFIGTAFIIMLEEFPDLLGSNVTNYILESLYNNTVGDSYRVGGVDSDNLYPSYSNPSIMRAFVAGWTGRHLNVANMTQSGENYATAIIELFDRADTLSEFNSGTYAGVSMFALTLWAKYIPDGVMAENGAFMLKHTWESISSLYHAGLKNVAGPWDRTYGYDMNRYLSILSLHIWAYLGQDIAPISNRPVAMSHSSDFAIAPMIAILSPFANALVNSIGSNITSALSKFPGEHTVSTSAFSPPYDLYPRNISAWLAENISIGGEQLNETVIGGPAESSSSFNPAVIQWNTRNTVAEIGFITLYATESAITAVATAGQLNITYPLGNSSSIFTLLVSPFTNKLDVTSWDDIQGLSVKVSGNANMTYELSFCGALGGTCSTINDFEFWNFTYTMPADSQEAPNLVLDVELQ